MWISRERYENLLAENRQLKTEAAIAEQRLAVRNLVLQGISDIAAQSIEGKGMTYETTEDGHVTCAYSNEMTPFIDELKGK